MTREEKERRALCLQTKIYRMVWTFCWTMLARWMPRTLLSGWKRWLLRLFGAKVSNEAVVYSTAKIYDPRNLVMEGKSVIGPKADVYNVDTVTLKDGAIISQEAYICTSSHDIGDPDRRLVMSPITLESGAWVAAYCRIGQGITIAVGAVVSMGTVLSKSVPPYAVVSGNPAKIVGFRFTPEELIDYQKRNVNEACWVDISQYEKKYKKFFLDKIVEIKKFISL